MKTEIFSGPSSLESIFAYQKFIKENQNIEIIAVTKLDHNFILLTYKDDK